MDREGAARAERLVLLGDAFSQLCVNVTVKAKKAKKQSSTAITLTVSVSA